MVKEEGLFQ